MGGGSCRKNHSLLFFSQSVSLVSHCSKYDVVDAGFVNSYFTPAEILLFVWLTFVKVSAFGLRKFLISSRKPDMFLTIIPYDDDDDDDWCFTATFVHKSC